MKKVTIAVVTLFALCLMSGCSSEPPTVVDINKVADELRTEITYQDELSKLTDSMFDSVYDIDRTLLKQVVAYTSSGATAEEIVALELNSADDAKTAEDALKDRLDYLKEGYADYGPEEVPKIDNAVVRVSGTYVFMSISNDHEKAAEILKSNLG